MIFLNEYDKLFEYLKQRKSTKEEADEFSKEKNNFISRL